jgi:hypothetical protein
MSPKDWKLAHDCEKLNVTKTKPYQNNNFMPFAVKTFSNVFQLNTYKKIKVSINKTRLTQYKHYPHWS